MVSKSQHIVEVNDSNFDSLVLNNPLPAWVTYGASWCPPCKAFAPTHELVAASYEGKVASFHVDVDEAPELAAKAGITSVPTHVCYVGGIGKKRRMGALSRSQAEAAYQELIS